MKLNLTEIFVLIIYLAIIFTLVRPNSQGPALVKNFTGGIADLVKSATGGGSFNP